MRRQKIRPLNSSKAMAFVLLLGSIIFLGAQHRGANGLTTWVRRLASLPAIAIGSEVNASAVKASDALPVSTTAVEFIESYKVSRTYNGELVAGRTSPLGFEAPGRLVSVSVEEGETVTAGTVLAALDTQTLESEQQDLQAQRAQAIAQLQEMEVGARTETIAASQARIQEREEQLNLSRKRLSRRQALYEQGAISLEQLDEFTSEAAVLEAQNSQAVNQFNELLAGTRIETIEAQLAQVSQIDARIQQIEIKLANSTLVAPFSGTISTRAADEGTIVAAGQPIVHLVEDSALEAHVGVPAQVAAILEPGSQQQVRIGDRAYAGWLAAKAPEFNKATRTQTVILVLDPIATAPPTPGQVVNLDVSKTVQAEGFWLPTGALLEGVQGLWSCYALVEAGVTADSASMDKSAVEPTFSVEKRDVEILKAETDRVLVKGNLRSGDRVVSDGIHRIVPGQSVTPAN